MKNPEPKIKTIIAKLKRVVTSDEIQLLLQNNIISMQVLNSLWNKDIDLSLPQKPVKEQKYPMAIKIYDCLGHLYRKERTDGTYRYTIQYRRDGYNVYVSGDTIEEAKKAFIEKIKAPAPTDAYNKYPKTFNAFATYYFNNFRKKKVTFKTFQNDMNRYKLHILPRFNEQRLTTVTALQCQTIIDELKKEGKGKTAVEVHSLLSVILKSALAHGVINKNPLALVLPTKHEKEHGTALTKEEEKQLLTATSGTEYQLMFALALYTGMRPNEYKTARREGDFIICVNSKRKTEKVEYKRIPISPMLAPYIQNTKKLFFYKDYTLREKIKEILPNHKLYDLRTTFYSRCIECGITDLARDLFVGHSLGTLGNTYTSISDEYLLNEMLKFYY